MTKRFLNCTVIGLIVISAMSMSIESIAESDNKLEKEQPSQKFFEEVCKNYGVSNQEELICALENSRPYDNIVLKNDIKLDRSINIDKSIQIDLNDHVLTVDESSEAKIICGNKKLMGVSSYTVYKPGYYERQYVYSTDRNKRPEVKLIYHPGYNEVKYSNSYSYKDNVEVTFRNGAVVKENAKDGANKNNDVSDANGDNGLDGKNLIELMSGNIILDKAVIKGANGGSGGNGGYQKLWHIPFFGGGDGGRGGKGGNGGSAIQIQRPNLKIILKNRSAIMGGKGGRGGQGSEPNPNYYLWSGKRGTDGSNGYHSLGSNMMSNVDDSKNFN